MLTLKISTTPKNKKHFTDLIKYYKKITPILEKEKINPILYGSLACFAFSLNKSLKVNDLDFYVKEKDLTKLKKIFKKSNQRFHYNKKYHTLEIYYKNIKIDFDSIDYWSKGISKKTIIIDFQKYNLKLKSLDKKTLGRIYQKAFDHSKDKKSSYEFKLNLLKN